MKKIGVVGSKEDLDKANIELYIKERKRINDNLESFKLAERAKQEAAAETNRILQEQADIIIETNKRNAEKRQGFLCKNLCPCNRHNALFA